MSLMELMEMITGLFCVLAIIGASMVVKWAHERWRTRKDKGYSTRDTGAF